MAENAETLSEAPKPAEEVQEEAATPPPPPPEGAVEASVGDPSVVTTGVEGASTVVEGDQTTVVTEPGGGGEDEELALGALPPPDAAAAATDAEGGTLQAEGASGVEGEGEPTTDAIATSVSFVKANKKSSITMQRKSIASVMSYDSSDENVHKNAASKAKLALGSIISIRRTSVGGEFFDRHRVARYMNSYKLDSEKPFHIEKVEKIMREILVEALENLSYDADKIPKQTKWASSAIRAKVKEQEYDRYKFVCWVTIGEKRSQDVISVFRFLWDHERDKFAKVVHENMAVFAIAVCFGIYYE